jgi:protein N-terminal amidase
MPGALWTSLEDGPYELASHCLERKSNILILLNNWLHSSESQAEWDNGQNDWKTLEYWDTRLRPLWARDGPASSTSSDAVGEPNEHHETIVIACNRSGTENGEVASAFTQWDRSV